VSEQICPECGLPVSRSATPDRDYCIIIGGDNCRGRTIARLKARVAELEAERDDWKMAAEEAQRRSTADIEAVMGRLENIQSRLDAARIEALEAALVEADRVREALKEFDFDEPSILEPTAAYDQARERTRTK